MLSNCIPNTQILLKSDEYSIILKIVNIFNYISLKYMYTFSGKIADYKIFSIFPSILYSIKP